MEIIFRGKPPGEKVINSTCSNCKTVFRYKESEGKITYDQRDGNFISIACPVCGNAVNTDMRIV